MIVGLTGQTGAGKTTVSRRFAERGFGIVDCDAVAREVTCLGSPCLSDLTAEFGTSIQNSDGSLHRHILGEIVFSHREKLERLNQIIFPYIRENVQEKISSFQKEGISIVILDAPTLFESGVDHICDYIVSVMAEAPLRQRRIMERDGLSEEDSRRRMDSQLPESFFEKHSDYIIRNNGRLGELLSQTDKAAEKIKERTNGH